MAEEFIVKSAIPERLYVKVYHDFLDSTIVTGKEKIVFILLKRYLNFKQDEGSLVGNAYPTLDTLSKQAGMTKKTVAEIIKKLEKKGLVDVKQQGLNRPNIYTLRDFSSIWKAKTDAEVKEAVEAYEDESEELLLIERLRSKGYRVTKEKESDTSADQSNDASDTNNNHYYGINTTLNHTKSQGLERYSIEEIKELYDYSVMINDHSELKDHIDSVMEILHTTLNSTKKSIRISGESRPTLAVIGKLMKLGYSEILYCIRKYIEQTGRIKNPTAYMLTLLYGAKEQMNLDLTNQVQHDLSEWNDNEKK